MLRGCAACNIYIYIYIYIYTHICIYYIYISIIYIYYIYIKYILVNTDFSGNVTTNFWSSRLISNTLLRICKLPQKFFHWRCLKCEIGLLQKASFKTTIFFQKSILTNLLRTSDNMLQKLLFQRLLRIEGRSIFRLQSNI